MRKDARARPANIERAFLLLTVSSNVDERINSVQESDRRDVISGERVAVISYYRIELMVSKRSEAEHRDFFF